MPYEAKGPHKETFGSTPPSQPGCIIFLVDQSGSMSEQLGGVVEGIEIQKMHAAADVINHALQEIVVSCRIGELIKDRVFLSIIGYGERVGPALGGVLAGRELVSISEVATNPVKVETRTKLMPDGAGGLVQVSVPFPIWLYPVAGNRTPMCKAFEMAYSIAERWCREHPNGHPPIVANITDGMVNDGDPTPITDRIAQLSTDDGDVTIFNCHLSKTKAPAVRYPYSEAQLPHKESIDDEEYNASRLLFNISSKLPPTYISYAKAAGAEVDEGSVGMVFKADLTDLTKFVIWQSRVAIEDRAAF